MRLASLSSLLLVLGSCGGGSADQPRGAGGAGGNGTMPGGTAGASGTSGTAPQAGSAGFAAGGDAPINEDDAPAHEVTFEPTDEVLLNPERGFYATTNLVDAPDLSDLRASGVTLVHSYVRLDDYRTSNLPASLLEQVSVGFARARDAGVKVILRFAYNFGPYPDSEPDAPKSWVLAHIVGTYPEGEVDAYRDYVSADSAFVPMGGETCAESPPRSECPSALAEMAKLHFTYINREFHEGVLQSWQSCLPEMEQRLGYRLSFVTASIPEAVRPGGSFTLRVALANSGFAAPINARPVLVVLSGIDTELALPLADVDVRSWLKGAVLQARLRVPAGIQAGQYRLALRLPDASPALKKPEYCLRFANRGTWDEASCDNVLGQIEIAANAPGTSVDDAAAFEVLPE